MKHKNVTYDQPSQLLSEELFGGNEMLCCQVSLYQLKDRIGGMLLRQSS